MSLIDTLNKKAPSSVTKSVQAIIEQTRSKKRIQTLSCILGNIIDKGNMQITTGNGPDLRKIYQYASEQGYDFWDARPNKWVCEQLLHNGLCINARERTNQPTLLSPTNKLHYLISDFDRQYLPSPHIQFKVKDAEGNKHFTYYNGLDDYMSIVAKIEEAYCNYMSNHEVSLDENILPVMTYRSYSDLEHTTGGRAYTTSNIEQIRKADRMRLKIDNMDITEVDYSCLHTTMLYNKFLNIEAPHGDMYDVGVDGDNIRSAVKILMNIMINTSSLNSVVYTLINKQYIDKSKSTIDNQVMTSEYFDLKKELDANGLTLRDLVDKIKDKHKDISEFFGTGVGASLQKHESDIMSEVRFRLISEDIPCLPLHDAVIVRDIESDREFAKQVMHEAYVKRIGFDIKIDGSKHECSVEEPIAFPEDVDVSGVIASKEDIKFLEHLKYQLGGYYDIAKYSMLSNFISAIYDCNDHIDTGVELIDKIRCITPDEVDQKMLTEIILHVEDVDAYMKDNPVDTGESLNLLFK
jgi:hypothetical protein